MPEAADDGELLIEFQEEGRAATINYNVPLPGYHSGRRILALDGVPASYFKSAATHVGTSIAKAAGLEDTGSGARVKDEEKLVKYLANKMVEAGYDKTAVWTAVETEFAEPSIETARAGRGSKKMKSSRMPDLGLLKGPSTPPPLDPEIGKHLREAFYTLKLQGELQIATKDWGNNPTVTTVDPSATPTPRLFIVEVYGISSFLGDYGLGRTVKTFTLFPGEQATISLKTWRSSKENISEGASIIDSYQSEAKTKFGNAVMAETTDKSTQSSKENWHVEAQASASFGFGSASISGGGGGEYQSGREEFAKRVGETTQEHANQASAARETQITSKSERTEETGEESYIERTIRNVNVRRTLNFVFRELNQEYSTLIHLRDIRIAFSNGNDGVWREVPVSGLRGLLEEVLVPSRINEIATSILKRIAVVFDHTDTPISILQRVELDASEQRFANSYPQDVGIGANIPPPDGGQFRYYRFKRGELGQAGQKNKVPGVVLQKRTIVMRTDSVFVEALLGQADALDSYAMQIQVAAADAKTLENDRERLAHAVVNAIGSPVEKAAAFAEMLKPADSAGETP